MVVVLGETGNQYFNEITDSAGDTYGATVCGDRLYEIWDVSSNVLSHYVSVQASDDVALGDWMIVVYSEDEDDEGFANLALRVTFADYPLSTSPTYPNR